MVYIYPEPASEREDDPRVAVEEDPAFRDESVVVAARFFDCVRIHEDNAREDRTLKGYARSAPCLVFVRPDFTAAKSLRGRFSASRIFPLMCATLKLDYDNCARKALKEQEKLEEELAKLYQRRAELAVIEEEIAQEKDAGRRGQRKAERDALAREVDGAEQTLRAQENALYELKPKTGA
jgi:hypothetical protein